MPTFAGFECYGGATITCVVDGSGAEWIGCCAKKQSNGAFGFYAFKNGVNVPLAPFCSGRGSLCMDGRWIAWDGAVWYMGALPGFVPLPAGQKAPTQIPPNGAIAALWHGEYTGAEFDTPEETALRVEKQLKALNELVDLLKLGGVLVSG
jgi:hypothetical protein